MLDMFSTLLCRALCLLRLTLKSFLSSIFHFFFQAEDGIRDVAVTGVQTCALPIFSTIAASGASAPPDPSGALNHRSRSQVRRSQRSVSTSVTRVYDMLSVGASSAPSRSEERRVGEEGRCRWAADHEEKKRET